MIFHENFFQCLAGAIPLFLTPQKIGLLKIIENRHVALQFFKNASLISILLDII